jgi:hypothetical protein
MRGDLQLISDIQLMDKLFLMDSALHYTEDGIITAFAEESFLTGLWEKASEHFKGLIDTSSTGSILKSVLKIFEAGALFSWNPLLGVLDIVAQEMFNISLTDIAFKIKDAIWPKISSGIKVTSDEINKAAMDAVGTTSEGCSNDLFYGVRELEDSGQLTKIGSIEKLADSRNIIWRILGALNRHKGKILLAALAAWMVKVLLWGAGLLMVGSVAAKFLRGEDEEKTEEKPTTTEVAEEGEESEVTPAVSPTTAPSPDMTPSGAGERDYSGMIWIEPIYGDISNTVMDWAESIYPQLTGYDDIITRTPSFQRVVTQLAQNFDPSRPGYLVMPKQYRSRVAVVNQFAGDAKREIQKVINEPV